jgi:hypothetical protein
MPITRYLSALLIAAVAAVGCTAPPPDAAHPFQAHPWATCIRHVESDRGPAPHVNGYHEKNPRSTASGAYQFLDSTWRNVSAAAGHGGTASARDASPWVQDAVAEYAYHHGLKRHWTSCRNL